MLATCDAFIITTWRLDYGLLLSPAIKNTKIARSCYFLPMVDIHRYQLSSSLTFAVNTSPCYTCVNNLGPVQVLEPPCCSKALTFSNSGKLSIKTRQRNLVAVTQRNAITRTCIFEAMITSFCFADSYKNTNKCLNISENIG